MTARASSAAPAALVTTHCHPSCRSGAAAAAAPGGCIGAVLRQQKSVDRVRQHAQAGEVSTPRTFG